MAKGNDGNLLQHFIECQLAGLLTEDARELHLVCTHAMEPFGAVTAPDDAYAAAFRAALDKADKRSTWPLLAAYGRTRASLAQYPNTAELVAALVGESRLSGVLCEKDEIHVSVLGNRWAASELRVQPGNWRTALERGLLEPPESGTRPWLFSMDPFTWLMEPELNKASRGPNLCRADLELLRPTFGRYAQAAAPGAMVLLVYKVDEAHGSRFRRGAIHLADRLGLERTFLGVPAAEGARHLAAVLSPTAGLAARLAEAWSAFRAEASLG